MPAVDAKVAKKSATAAKANPKGTGSGNDALKDPLTASVLDAKQGNDSGDLFGDLLLRGARQIGDESTVFSLEGKPLSAEPGRFDFPEDDQTDPLPELREKHSTKEYGRYDDNKPAVKGAGDDHEIDPHDVAQGALGDCYLIASMAAVARANPDQIKNLITDNGDGTYGVTLYLRKSYYSNPTKVTKTIDARLPNKEMNKLLYAKGTDTDADGNAELWPALLEKAVAQETGSYEQISGGNIGKNLNFKGGLELLTGKDEGYIATSSISADDAILEIGVALESKKPVTVDSKDMSGDASLAAEAEKLNVYGNHAYAPEKVNLDNMTMDLQNPWGSSHVKALKATDFMKYYRAIRIGS